MRKHSEKNGSVGRIAAREIAYLALSVALITVCAWISVPVGAIPVTLQTLAVAFLGGLLGARRSVIAVAVYLLMGLVGIPVFAGFRAGVPALAGATGGYLFGFVFLALLPALFKRIPVKGTAKRCALFYAANVLGLAVCYLFGTVWFVLIYQCEVGYALMLCVVPYLLPDAIKLAVAAFLSARLEKYIKSSRSL